MGRNGFAENKQGNGFAGMQIMLMVDDLDVMHFPQIQIPCNKKIDLPTCDI
jgi:hypothetical protein